MSVVIRPVALAELEEARAWYDEHRPGLGDEFARAADESIRHVGAAPTMFPSVHGSIRRLLMRRFPYGIFYRSSGAEVVVLGVLHLRRDPGRWQSRR